MYNTQPSPYLDENVMLKAPLIISHETGGLDALADLQDLLNECQRADGLPLYDGVPSDALTDESHPYWESHDMEDIGQEIVEHLGQYLPPFCSITENDGCFIVLPNVEQAIEDMAEQGRALDDSCITESEPAHDGEGLFLHINDHGNVSLNFYRKDGQTFELWAVV